MTRQPTMIRRPSGGLGFERKPTEPPLPDWVLENPKRRTIDPEDAGFWLGAMLGCAVGTAFWGLVLLAWWLI